jgi:hypothetical protein
VKSWMTLLRSESVTNLRFAFSSDQMRAADREFDLLVTHRDSASMRMLCSGGHLSEQSDAGTRWQLECTTHSSVLSEKNPQRTDLDLLRSGRRNL